jgi:hypothetical protein
MHTKISVLTTVATFLRDVVHWGWDDVPAHPQLFNVTFP